MSDIHQTPVVPRPAQVADEGGRFLIDGKSVCFTFCLVSSLCLLRGICNGLIDVMDKHFQEELHLSLSQAQRACRIKAAMPAELGLQVYFCGSGELLPQCLNSPKMKSLHIYETKLVAKPC